MRTWQKLWSVFGCAAVLALTWLLSPTWAQNNPVTPLFVTPAGDSMVDDTNDGLKVSAKIVDGSGAVVTPAPAQVGTCTRTNTSDDNDPAQTIAANADRLSFSIHNDSTAILYLNIGGTATTTAFSVKIPADGYWNMESPMKTEALSLIWSADASGAGRSTECEE